MKRRLRSGKPIFSKDDLSVGNPANYMPPDALDCYIDNDDPRELLSTMGEYLAEESYDELMKAGLDVNDFIESVCDPDWYRSKGAAELLRAGARPLNVLKSFGIADSDAERLLNILLSNKTDSITDFLCFEVNDYDDETMEQYILAIICFLMGYLEYTTQKK